MDSEARNPAQTARLRLVDLRVDGEHVLHFGGGFSGVLAGNGTRSAAARAIACTIVGPRPAGASGAIDVAGSLVSVWSLPTPLLPHDAPVVIDPDLVRSLWTATTTRARGRLAAEHGVCRLEVHRLEAQLAELGVTAAAAAEPAPHSPEAGLPEPSAHDQDAELATFMQSVKTYGRVESLVAALEPEPVPEAQHLAELVDANVALTRRRAEVGDGADIDFDAADRRLKLARIEAALTSGAVGHAERYEIERRHRAVVDAEKHLSEVGPRRRPRAIVRYDAAVAAEQQALADVGIDSYAMFLLALTPGESRPDERARQAAHDELVAATAAFEQATLLRDLPSRVELETRAQVLRDHARTLLGREPGRDLSADLRTLRARRADYDDRLRELVMVLQTAGTAVGDDPVADARRFLMSPPSIQIDQQREWPMPGPRWTGRVEDSTFQMPGDARQPVDAVAVPGPQQPPEPAGPSAVELAQIEALERELAEQRQRADDLEEQMAELEAARTSDLAQLSPEALMSALQSTLAAYRAGTVLDGKVPLVFDGVLDRLRPEACDAAIEVLLRADDLQAIVVSNDPLVVQRIHSAGGTIVQWPAPESSARDAAQFTG